MSYLVLARKWRPTQFDEVIGQEHVAQTLINAIEQDRVAHAFLFTGARGVGKTSTARILAKALNCENSPGATPRPCGTCNSCEAITSGQSVDVFEIDGASNRGINEIRELRESVRYAPSRARSKIYIIDEVHMLTTEAFNALLKTLEEPPPHAKFIFATTEPQKIPVTILSRCQRYDFKRIGLPDIISYLEHLCTKEGITAEREALQVVARQAAGGMRDALSLLDQVISFAGTTITESQVAEILGVANRRHLFELSAAVLGSDPGAALLALDEVNRYGYDLQHFSGELVRHFRDLMVASVVADPRRVTDLTESELGAAKVQVDGIEPTVLHRAFTVLSACTLEMARSSFPKMVLEMALLRLSKLEPLIGLDTMVARLSVLESSFDDELLPVDYGGATAERSVRLKSGQGTAQGSSETKTDAHQASAPVPAPSEQSAPEPVPTELNDSAEAARSPVTEANDTVPEAARSSERVEASAAVPEPARSQEGTVSDVVSTEAVKPNPSALGARQAGSKEREVSRDLNAPPPGHPAYIEPKVGDVALNAARAPKDQGRRNTVLEAESPRAIQESKDEVPSEVEAATPSLVSTEAPEAYSAGESKRDDTAAVEASSAAHDVPESVLVRFAPDQVAAMSATQRWQAVVDGIRTYSLPLAATCEHAYVERFEDGIVELSFSDRYLDFIQEEERLKRVAETVSTLFGQRYQVTISTRSDTDSGDDLTIAESRDVKLDERRKSLKEEVLNDPVVKEAQELFEVEPDALRVQVKLFDDP